MDQDEQLVSMFELILASLDEWLVERPDGDIGWLAPHEATLLGLGSRFPEVLEYWVDADLPASRVIAGLIARR